MEASPTPKRRGERGVEQPSRKDSFAEFQPNILELFLGRLWSVELCFYQAAGSFNKIFMAGKVLFMEIRLLKCLLGGGGPHQLAFLPTTSLLPFRMASPSSNFFPLPIGPELPGQLELLAGIQWVLSGCGAPRTHGGCCQGCCRAARASCLVILLLRSPGLSHF